MATVKTPTTIWSSQTLTAGAGDTTSSSVDLTDGYGAVLMVRLLNGGTGPTIAAQVQIQVSHNGSDWYNSGTLVGSAAANASISWGIIAIDPAVPYVRLVAGSNTGQNVTVSAYIVEIVNNNA